MVYLIEIQKAYGDKKKLKEMLGYMIDPDALELFDDGDCEIISWINSDLYITTKVIIDDNTEITECIVTVQKDYNHIYNQYHITLD